MAGLILSLDGVKNRVCSQEAVTEAICAGTEDKPCIYLMRGIAPLLFRYSRDLSGCVKSRLAELTLLTEENDMTPLALFLNLRPTYFSGRRLRSAAGANT